MQSILFQRKNISVGLKHFFYKVATPMEMQSLCDWMKAKLVFWLRDTAQRGVRMSGVTEEWVTGQRGLGFPDLESFGDLDFG